MINSHAKYTLVLRSLMDDPEGKKALDKAMSTYPLYVPMKEQKEFIPNVIPTREELNRKILNHYKYREIGFETVGRFLDELEISLCEIMPYYNQLMFTQDQDFNVIYNVDYQRTVDTQREGSHSSELSGQTTGSETGGQNNKHVRSDTPQDELKVAAKDINNISYATEVEWDKGESNSSSKMENSQGESGEDKQSEKTLETTKGNFGVTSAQDLVLKYRETILNIEQMIINDTRIKELFMLVW